MWDFPDGPVVMTLHPTAQGVSSIPGQETKISACCMIHTAQRVCVCVCVCILKSKYKNFAPNWLCGDRGSRLARKCFLPLS